MGQPLLSINIPIYNRSSYLDRMLARFLEDKDLFEDKVALFISDNCSKEPLPEVVQKYSDQGLRIAYERNETNIGGDGNIVKCFKHGGGEYVWVLGSDDIPCRGIVREIIRFLDSGEYGVLHLSEQSKKNGFHEYESADAFFESMHVWVTFISGNIVSGQFVTQVPLDNYESTSFAQVPVYLAAGYGSKRNAIWEGKVFESGSDAANNGGYNLFRVFCDNLLTILDQAVSDGYMKRESFLRIKKSVYKNFTVKYILPLLILRKTGNFEVSGGFGSLFRNYGGHLYSYVFFAREVFRSVCGKIGF